MSSNFSKLIDRIDLERRSRSNAVPNIIQLQKSTAANKMHCKSMIKSMRNLQKSLTPTRDELKMENRQRMDHFNKSLRASVETGSITGIEAIKAETAAHRLSASLGARGLI